MATEPQSNSPTESSALLITGAAGKTGGYAARLLLERGHRVRAMVHRYIRQGKAKECPRRYASI